jgi:uncharacterized membrane protein YedE/YeeE
MLAYITPLFLGVFFGFALSKGGLTRYGNIAGVFRFTNLTVIKFMLTALIVAGCGLYLLKTFGAVTFPPPPASYLFGNLIGGLIFGVGMSLAGYCPGTVAAGAGEGQLDYLIPGVLGLITGAILFGLTYQKVFPPILKVANLGNTTLPELLNVDPLLAMGVFTTLVLLLFYFLERGLKRKDRLDV